ncbi:MAG: UPF0262 family protein [Rickettsiales bacterium]
MPTITYNRGELPSDICINLGGYFYDLLDEDGQAGFRAPQPGPYDIDISTQESTIAITLKSATGEHLVELPIRAWRQRIIDRMGFVEGSTRVMRSGSSSQIEAHDRARRQHHNESAELLEQAFVDTGASIDFETARNLFAVLAEVVAPNFRQRGGQGSDTPPLG